MLSGVPERHRTDGAGGHLRRLWRRGRELVAGVRQVASALIGDAGMRTGFVAPESGDQALANSASPIRWANTWSELVSAAYLGGVDGAQRRSSREIAPRPRPGASRVLQQRATVMQSVRSSWSARCGLLPRRRREPAT